jgi:hypothetical protein
MDTIDYDVSDRCQMSLMLFSLSREHTAVQRCVKAKVRYV